MAGDPTPSQTVGPFFGFALPFADDAQAVDPRTPGAARIEDVRFFDDKGAETLSTSTGNPLRALVEIQVTRAVPDAVIEVFYYSRDGRTLHCQQSTAVYGGTLTLLPGQRRLEFTCEAMGLQPGVYAIGASIRERTSPGTLDWWYGARLLYVEPGKSVRGYFYAPHEWRWADAAVAADRRPADI